MSQSVRQSELFAGEDWTVLYRAFTEINFNAYDFDTIRESMVEYVRFNFPEDFDDWIESSEFVALIDLIAYLGQTLAFRMDLNTRENFIDDAERRESVLKLARLLSYSPSRNITAEGLVKIEALQTDEPIIDSLGQNLQNVLIDWNDANNPDWFEQWVLVSNSAFIGTNPFGKPTKSGTISSIPTQLYQLDNNPTSSGTFSFNATVRNQTLPFEIVNVDFTDNESFYEKDPNVLFSFNMVYRNDGLGNQSPNSGFFLYFKQGSQSFEDFNIEVPLENRVIDIDINNINNTDVWVQTINDNGTTLIDWTKVPAVFGNNVIFNSLTENQRNIFSVITRDNDQISVRFADGVFGNVPTGNIRVYYRTSTNQTYFVKTSDINRKQIQIPYFNAIGDPHTLTVTFSLKEAVANAVESETIAQIKERAPLVYYAQNRMVNGEDYNVFPLRSTNILKLKSINRIYSGHSRFIDINDPTATFQDVNVFADDGAVYEEFDDNYTEIPLSANKTSGEIISITLFEFMKNPELQQFYYREYPLAIDNLPGSNPLLPSGPDFDTDPFITWDQATTASFSSTGQFKQYISGVGTPPGTAVLGQAPALGTATSVGVDDPAVDTVDFIREGSLVEFNAAGWVKVATILDDGVGFDAVGKGKVTLAEPVSTNDWVKKVYPAFRTDLVTTEINTIKAEIDDQNTFGMRFDYSSQEWVVIKAANLAPWDSSIQSVAFSLTNAGDNTLTNKDASWLIRFDFKTDRWQVTAKGLRYVYESEKDVRFFVNQFYKVAGAITGRASRDTITVFGTNPLPSSAVCGLGEDLTFRNLDIFTYEDGHTESRRVLITYNDADEDGVPDDPDIFVKIALAAQKTDGTITKTPEVEQYIFHKKVIDQYGYENFALDPSIVAVPRIGLSSAATACPSDSGVNETLTCLQYFDENCNVVNISPLIQEGTVVFSLAVSKETVSSGEPLFSKYDPNNEFGNTTGTGTTPVDAKCDPVNYVTLNSNDYQYHIGRRDLNFLWKHFATKDQRIDPAITNIIDSLVLTTAYDNEYRLWIDSDTKTDEPEIPTSEQLDIDFSEFDENKMVSDEIIWRSVTYKPLFGEKASEELRARIKVVKVANTEVTDNEIKSQVINTINDYFAVENWGFGDTFFASEMAAYVHQQLPTIVGGFEIVPLNEESKFGNLQQIKADSDEIFISVAKVSDVEIIPVFTGSALRVGK